MSQSVKTSLRKNSLASKPTSSTFTVPLLLAMAALGALAFISVALIPFRHYSQVLNVAIVAIGPIAILALIIRARFDESYFEPSRYCLYAYAIGLCFGMTCLGAL